VAVDGEGEDEVLVELDEAPVDFDVRKLVNSSAAQESAKAELRNAWELYIYPFFGEGTFLSISCSTVEAARLTSVRPRALV
jgi:hypothetical protein